jgi:hypothetical protein
MPPLFVVHGSDLVPIGGWGEKLCSPKVSGVQTGIISKLYLESPGTKSHSDAGAVGEHRKYYVGGRWWLPPNPGRDE